MNKNMKQKKKFQGVEKTITKMKVSEKRKRAKGKKETLEKHLCQHSRCFHKILLTTICWSTET